MRRKKRCPQCRRRVKTSRRYRYNDTFTAVDAERHTKGARQCQGSGVNLRESR